MQQYQAAAAAMAQQAGGRLFPQQKGMPLQQQQHLFCSPHPLQEHRPQLIHQHQEAIHGQLGGGGGTRAGVGGGGTNNGMQPWSQTEASLAVSSGGGGRRPSKQPDSSGAGHGGGGGGGGDDGSHKKGSDEAR